MSEMAVATRQQMGIRIQTLGELQQFAQLVVRAGWAPRGTTPEQAIVAMQFGMELGLSPLQSLQNISVVNNRPAVWGDAMPALVHASGLMVNYEEKVERPSKDEYVVYVTVQRRGQKPITRDFSISKAKRAGLWGKPGTWTTNPSRMILIRARTFAFRDAFADVMKGMTSVEEALDTPQELQQVEIIPPKARELPALEAFFPEPQPISEGGAFSTEETEIDVNAETETGPVVSDDPPRPRRSYTRRNKPAEAAPVPPQPPATQTPPQDAKIPTPSQEPPRPLMTKRDQLISDIFDLHEQLKQSDIPHTLRPGIEAMSVDDLVKEHSRLAAIK